VRRRGEIAGFIKIDTEGHGLEIIRGAMKTLKAQHPSIALACYHERDELFLVPWLIQSEFPEYNYKFHMHGGPERQGSLNELTFYVYPRSLVWADT
jgi:hypothetical protein